MAIFGRAVTFLNQTEYLWREGNDWDAILNYFFAILFMFTLLIGISIGPFLIAYHFQQKKTFSTTLFLLISFLDLFKSLYFPLFLIPKLLSPMVDINYYATDDVSLVSWTVYMNTVVSTAVWFEMDVIVVLNASRYFGFTRPLSSARFRNVAFSTVLILSFLRWCGLPVYHISGLTGRYYTRLYEAVSTPNIDNLISYTHSASYFLFMVVGGLFLVLTIWYLKKSDSATSEVSNQNIRKGIISMTTMCLFNLFVILVSMFYAISFIIMKKTGWKMQSTGLDFLQFSLIYGVPAIQSIFNSLCFSFTCCLFRNFVKKCVHEGMKAVIP